MSHTNDDEDATLKQFELQELELESAAQNCRTDLVAKNWTDIESTGRVSEPWREEFMFMVVRDTVLQTSQTRREALQAAGDVLMGKYPHLIVVIHQTVEKSVKKSPVEAFLKAFAYRWLKSLEARPPTAKWFPDFAVEVAHKLFRFQGDIKAFWNYVSNHSRRKMLPSIRFSEEGL